MLLWCPNRGCGKNTEARLNTTDNEVYCQDCGGVIPNISSFTKTTLKTLKQTTSGSGSKEAYAMKCTGCGKSALPNFDAKKNEFSCPSCKAVIVVGIGFKELIKAAIKAKEQEKADLKKMKPGGVK